MAKSFIDVVQASLRTGLGIPVKIKKPSLLNQYTARGTAFRLQTSRVVGSSLKWRTTLPSSVRPELPPAATRPLGKPTSRASQERMKDIPPISSFSCICGDVDHRLDSVHSGPAFPESELVVQETVLPDQEGLKPLQNQLLQKLPHCVKQTYWSIR